MIQFSCPCGASLRTSEDKAGKIHLCPQCRQPVKAHLPVAEVAPPIAPPAQKQSPQGLAYTVAAVIVFSIIAFTVYSTVSGISLLGKYQEAVQVENVVEGMKAARFVEVGTLVGDYNQNEVRADGIYKGKWLKTRGQVHIVGRGLLDNAYVVLAAGDEHFFTVMCSFPKDQEPNLANLRQGGILSVVGKCDGKLGHVQLKNCVVLK
jgi:hypothetical protein